MYVDFPVCNHLTAPVLSRSVSPPSVVTVSKEKEDKPRPESQKPSTNGSNGELTLSAAISSFAPKPDKKKAQEVILGRYVFFGVMSLTLICRNIAG